MLFMTDSRNRRGQVNNPSTFKASTAIIYSNILLVKAMLGIKVVCTPTLMGGTPKSYSKTHKGIILLQGRRNELRSIIHLPVYTV